MILYGVVSAVSEKVVEFFPTRGQAEAFVAEIEKDEPELAALMSVEEIEFAESLQ